jgi:hypothetical protein
VIRTHDSNIKESMCHRPRGQWDKREYVCYVIEEFQKFDIGLENRN